eukprot:704719-Rhodomonas_salina.1
MKTDRGSGRVTAGGGGGGDLAPVGEFVAPVGRRRPRLPLDQVRARPPVCSPEARAAHGVRGVVVTLVCGGFGVV